MLHADLPKESRNFPAVARVMLIDCSVANKLFPATSRPKQSWSLYWQHFTRLANVCLHYGEKTELCKESAFEKSLLQNKDHKHLRVILRVKQS